MTDVDKLSNDELRLLIIERNHKAREEEIANRTCRVCGEKDEEFGGNAGRLTDFSLTIADGEEGYSQLDTFLCEEHLNSMTELLVKAGMGLHVHGGICFLEDDTCPGYSDMSKCPTPEEQYPE